MKKVQQTVKRRRFEGKTDYLARLELLSSRQPRIVVRKTNRYILAQLVHSDLAQDKVDAGVSSKDLLTLGWPKELEGSLKSLPAAYLTGLLLAQKARNVKEAILDIGLQRNVKGSRIYAVLKGLIDKGLKVPHSAEALPNDKRLEENTRTRETFVKLKEKLMHGRKGN